MLRRALNFVFSLTTLLLWLPALALAAMWAASWHTLWWYQGQPPSKGGLALRAMVISGHVQVWEVNTFDAYITGASAKTTTYGYPMAISYESLKSDPPGLSVRWYRTNMTRSDWLDFLLVPGAVRVPLWMPVLVFLAIPACSSTLLLARQRRRRRLNHCLACGYPLADIAEHARCPECGKPPPPRKSIASAV